MATDVRDLVPGDYVRTRDGYQRIQTFHGIAADGRLAKPSEGGFWMETEQGVVTMWTALSYHKRADVEENHG